MIKLFSGAAAALFIATALPAAPALAALGPDSAACRSGRPALLVSIAGFKNRDGNVRVQLYGGNPADFLEKGKKLKRIDLPVTRSGAMDVCVAVPRPGTYAVSVHHDADADGMRGWNDGGGFTNNPPLSLAHLRPQHHEAAVSVGRGVKRVRVILNYRRGITVGPIGG